MRNVAEDTYKILANAGAVTAIFSTRIYPAVVPYDSAYPALCYRITSLDRYQVMTGASNVDKFYVRISVYGKTYAELHANQDVVITAMIAATSNYYSIILTSMSDDVEELQTVASTAVGTYTGQFLYIRNLDFQMFTK